VYYPSDDLEMIVRLLYERVNASEFAAIRGIVNIDLISEFWKVILIALLRHFSWLLENDD
jgi:hypothetical protein